VRQLGDKPVVSGEIAAHLEPHVEPPGGDEVVQSVVLVVDER
jgi:hypothetical protein